MESELGYAQNLWISLLISLAHCPFLSMEQAQLTYCAIVARLTAVEKSGYETS